MATAGVEATNILTRATDGEHAITVQLATSAMDTQQRRFQEEPTRQALKQAQADALQVTTVLLSPTRRKKGVQPVITQRETGVIATRCPRVTILTAQDTQDVQLEHLLDKVRHLHRAVNRVQQDFTVAAHGECRRFVPEASTLQVALQLVLTALQVSIAVSTASSVLALKASTLTPKCLIVRLALQDTTAPVASNMPAPVIARLTTQTTAGIIAHKVSQGTTETHPTKLTSDRNAEKATTQTAVRVLCA
jgi:hypothetical protein